MSAEAPWTFYVSPFIWRRVNPDLSIGSGSEEDTLIRGPGEYRVPSGIVSFKLQQLEDLIVAKLPPETDFTLTSSGLLKPLRFHSMKDGKVLWNEQEFTKNMILIFEGLAILALLDN